MNGNSYHSQAELEADLELRIGRVKDVLLSLRRLRFARDEREMAEHEERINRLVKEMKE